MPPLLVVEDAFARGKDAALLPKLVFDGGARAFAVKLKLPSGEERDAQAVLDVAHVRGPLPPFAVLRLVGVDATTIPKGTEIWPA